MATHSKPGDDSTADIEAQLAALRAEIAALTQTLTDLSRSGSDALKQAATEACSALKSGEDFAEAEARARQTLTEITDYARNNPLQSLGIAAGVGVMLGLLFGRR